jgi:RsiW-degrading membrane proteinase PrsW (M82 family)
MSVAIVRAIFSVPGHGLFGVLMGYYFSLAKFHESNKRIEYLIKSVLIAIIFHGGYDFVLMYMSAASDFPIVSVLLLIAFAWIVIKLWRLGISKINKHLSDDRENIQQF